MANHMNNLPQGNKLILQDQRKNLNGSPKMAPKYQKPTKNQTKNTTNGTSTGDVVSDESEGGAEEPDSSAIKENDDSSDDEADGFALSGARRVGNNASRLAGLRTKTMIDDESAVAGAEEDGSDDGYDAVNDISDSDGSEIDDDEASIMKAVEEDLIQEFRRTEKPRATASMANDMTGLTLTEDAALARRLSLQSEDDNDNLGELDFSQDPFGGLSTNDSLYQQLVEDAEGEFDNELTSWRTPGGSLGRESSMQSNGNEKKVRFAENVSSRSSSMSSEEDPRDSFPDLFADTDEHMTRSQFLVDMDIDDAVDDDESTYGFDYEFEDEHEKMAFEIDGESDSGSDSDSSDDSDSGDTTDEEDEETQIARVREYRAKHGLADPAGASASVPATPVGRGKNHVLARALAANGDGKPRLGVFKHDPTRAAVTADGNGVRLVCPSNPPKETAGFWDHARQTVGSRDGSPNNNGPVSWTRTTPRAPSAPTRPLTAKSTLGTMFDGNLDFLHSNDESGIAKALLMPARNNSVRSSFASNSTMDEIDGDDAHGNVNLEDFVQMDEDSDSEMEDPPSTGVLSPAQEHFPDFVHESSPLHNAETATLDHLHRGLVSSFRNNQHHARHVSSLAANPATRAQTSEANALQSGRRGAANTPMTPARKQRASQDLDHTGAGVKKASASPLVQKHRRSRGNSLSQTLALDRFATTLPQN